MSKHASDNKVPVIDLLPILSNKMQEEGAKPEDLFLDVDHLSVVGSEIVAEILADFIQKERLIIDKRIK